jgi:hypothetical protein
MQRKWEVVQRRGERRGCMKGEGVVVQGERIK